MDEKLYDAIYAIKGEFQQANVVKSQQHENLSLLKRILIY